MAISTNVVKHVLEAWVNNFLEDVYATHRNGEYLIEYEDLIEHINDMPYEAHVEIMLVAEDAMIADVMEGE